MKHTREFKRFNEKNERWLKTDKTIDVFLGMLAIEMSQVQQDSVPWGGMYLCRLGQRGWAEKEKEELFSFFLREKENEQISQGIQNFVQ